MFPLSSFVNITQLKNICLLNELVTLVLPNFLIELKELIDFFQYLKMIIEFFFCGVP